ncbi:hypothetical protein Ciccas_001699 [Cichlidogyrus casuarinus]|uniref:Uncharacterized protein n=1 Tax=Cichlidogyrus casuarinus TaxID=1844966 RepID=A0ABD2QJA4_9PLAT
MISSLDDDDENDDQKNKSGIVCRFTIPHFPSSNPFNIELQDLSSLIENLSIAYAGNITSPKWNQFKGVSFSLRDKIRLNNIIWREFHRQYIYKFQPIVVKFQAPLTEGHGSPEAIILEGKYWKRKVHTISNEYQKWRNFFRNQPHQPASATVDELLEAVKKITEPHKRLISHSQKELNDLGGIKKSKHQLQPYSTVKFESNFNSLMDKNLSFPHHRDICMLGNADVMQPGLTQLQPTTEEIHDDVLTSLLQGMASPAKVSQDNAFLVDLELPQMNQQGVLSFHDNHSQTIQVGFKLL